MIIDEFIDIKISHKTVKHYRTLGYDCNVFDKVKIKVKDLPKSSEVRINVKCSNCESINNISYNNYINKQMKKYDFYVCKNCSIIKRKITNEKKYGVSYYSQSNDFKQKVEETSYKKWGVSNYAKTDEYKKKSKETSNKKWGVDHYLMNSDNYLKLIKTIKEKYNVNNPSKINGVNIEKRKKTNLEKYGCEHAIQNEDIFLKCFKNRKKINNLYYDSKNELKFIELCISNNIYIERMKGVKYNFDSSDKIYYPDFFLPNYNLIVEIKSKWTYNIDLDKNLAKREQCLKNGYDFIFIIDNNFDEIKNILKK